MLTSDINISTIHTRLNSVGSQNSFTPVLNQSNITTFHILPIFANKTADWRVAAPIIYDSPAFTPGTFSTQANSDGSIIIKTSKVN